MPKEKSNIAPIAVVVALILIVLLACVGVMTDLPATMMERTAAIDTVFRYLTA